MSNSFAILNILGGSTWGSDNRTYLLAPRQTEKDVPGRPSAAEQWLPMFIHGHILKLQYLCSLLSFTQFLNTFLM